MLSVEDNAINRLVLEGMLNHFATEQAFANNGQEALDLLPQHPDEFDIIFMDCQMPVMDGYETTRRIRQGEAPQHPYRGGNG